MKNVHDIGLEVDKLRGRAGLSKAELARLSDIRECTISLIINGANVPTERTLRKLAEALPLDLEEWIEPIRRYHRECKARAQRSAIKAKVLKSTEREQDARPLPTKKETHAGASIGEICRAARAAGMTYGEYMQKHPYL